jgi:serine/threonine-protein kinase HipA
MTSERECFVYIVLPGQTEFATAGRFRISETRGGAERGEFIYGRSYLRRADAVELDPTELRLSTRLYETGRMGGFFGAIRDSMPDYWGRLVIEKHSGHVRLEEFDYLMEGADDRAGALGFGRNVEPPAPRRRFNRTLDLDRLHAEADAIVAGEQRAAGPDAAQVQTLLLEGTSMGGARPKAVVQDDHVLWIAKFSRYDDRWNNTRVEHALLLLARDCGLNAAHSRIESIGDRDAILVRRFDRYWSADGIGFLRYRMVSALTLLQTEDTQAGRPRWSYLLLADEVRRASANPREDLRELFGRMCFNAAISNLDDHPRNHALLASDRGWRLSPAYDLTPSPVVAKERRYLAMACGPAGRFASKANLVGGAGRFLLDREEAEAIFDRIAEQVRGSWRATMRREGVSEQDCDAIGSAFLYDGLFLERTDALEA